MKRIFYPILLACLACLPLTTQAQQDMINVLYIANSEPADGGDAIVIDSLEAMGYNVTELAAGAYNEFSHTDFSADVVVFGEALSSSAVTPFANADFPTPCVSMEGYCVRENRWALTTNDQFGQVLSADNMPEVVADPDVHFGLTVNVDHPVTAYAGISPGTTVKWSDETDSLPEVTYFELPQAAATAIANIEGEDARNTLWAIEPDANDATNPLNHRMVIWGIHDNGLEAGQANANFFNILDGAILWVMNMNDVSSIRSAANLAQLSAQPNPFQTRTDISFSLESAGEVTMEVFDLAGRSVAVQQGTFGTGNQQMTFERPQEMAAGIYHFNLRLDGMAFGTGKLIVQ